MWDASDGLDLDLTQPYGCTRKSCMAKTVSSTIVKCQGACKEIEEFQNVVVETTTCRSGQVQDQDQDSADQQESASISSDSRIKLSSSSTTLMLKNDQVAEHSGRKGQNQNENAKLSGVFGKLDTSLAPHPVEDEQIRHHRDVMEPGLRIRKDGYMLPTLIANCASRASSPAGLDDPCPDPDQFSCGNSKRKEAEGMLPPSCEGCGSGQSDEDGEVGVREMIRLCPQMKSFCPTPFEDPASPFEDFKCLPEWDKDILPMADETPGCGGDEQAAQNDCATREGGVLPLQDEFDALFSQPELNESGCEEVFNQPRLRPHEDFCPEPFEDPCESFNDFVCDDDARLDNCECDDEDLFYDEEGEQAAGGELPSTEEPYDNSVYTDPNATCYSEPEPTFVTEEEPPYCDELDDQQPMAQAPACSVELAAAAAAEEELACAREQLLRLQLQLKCCRKKQREAQTKLVELECQQQQERQQQQQQQNLCGLETQDCCDGATEPPEDCSGDQQQEQQPLEDDCSSDSAPQCPRATVPRDAMDHIICCQQKLFDYQTQRLLTQHQQQAEDMRQQQASCEKKLQCYQKALKDIQAKLETLAKKSGGPNNKCGSKQETFQCCEREISSAMNQFEPSCGGGGGGAPAYPGVYPPMGAFPGGGGGYPPPRPGSAPPGAFSAPPSFFGGYVPGSPFGPPPPSNYGPYGAAPYGYPPPAGGCQPPPPAQGGYPCQPSPPTAGNNNNPSVPEGSNEPPEEPPAADPPTTEDDSSSAKPKCTKPCPPKRNPSCSQDLEKVRAQFEAARKKKEKVDECVNGDKLKEDLCKCRRTLTEVRKKINICGGANDSSGDDNKTPVPIDCNENPDNALKCCLGQLQEDSHKLRCIMHDRIVGENSAFNSQAKPKSYASCDSCGQPAKDCTCGGRSSPFRASCEPAAAPLPRPPPISCSKMESRKVLQCMPVAFTGNGCQDSDFQTAPLNFPPAGGAYPAGQFLGFPPGQPQTMQPGLIPPQQSPYNPYGTPYPNQQQYPGWGAYPPGGANAFPPYGYDQPLGYSQQQQQPIPYGQPLGAPPPMSSGCDGGAGLNSMNEFQCPPGCIPMQDCEGMLAAAAANNACPPPPPEEDKCAGAADYNCDCGGEKLKKSFAMWDEIPGTKGPINYDNPEEFCKQFDTHTKENGFCPSFDKAAQDRCPELAARVPTQAQTLKLLKEGVPQCDLTCFSQDSTTENRKSVDWLHQNTCDCPVCSVSRLLQNESSSCDNDDDDDNDGPSDPCRCKECGCALDENGCPIQDEDDEDEPEEDPCNPDADKCNSKKFDHAADGKPVFEGAMCLNRATEYMWQASECPDNPVRLLGLTPDFQGFSSDGHQVPYNGGACLDRTTNFLWNRAEPEPEKPQKLSKCPPKQKKPKKCKNSE